MNNSYIFEYPNNLKIIFDKLYKSGIKPIIIGGYIRDFFLNIASKDIDIELYGVNSLKELESILKEFGELNSVGKSFGVCKLSLETWEIDFTLPRRDNKISSGHNGFLITLDNKLSFYEACSRRDFTINTIGYDVIEKKFLDPFNGIEDIKNKLLKAVNLKKFSQDPLRVLRLVGFASRFNFTIDKQLFIVCKKMCEAKVLFQLPQERIYTEIQKILLKSPKPSHAFTLLKELHALENLSPLDTLSRSNFLEILSALDSIKTINKSDTKVNLLLMLCTLCYKFDTKQTRYFIQNLTNNKSLLTDILSILQNDFKNDYSDYDLYKLATKVNIEYFLIFSQAIYPHTDINIFSKLKDRAKKLDILNKKAISLLRGRDIQEYGIEPSQEYSKILSLAYEAQINLEIKTYKEAKIWLKNYLELLT